MKLKSNVTLLCLLGIFVFSAMGCEKEGNVEKTGKKIDEAVDSVKDKINDATK